MPNYVLVDAEQLDSDLKVVAESIRAKGGTAEQLAFPEGFKAAVEAIVVETSTAVVIQRKTGTVTNGDTVYCGFKPDLVYLAAGASDYGYLTMACLAFEAAGNDKLNTTTWNRNDEIIDIFGSRTSSGFNCNLKTYDVENGWAVIPYQGRLSYIAVKYTE